MTRSASRFNLLEMLALFGILIASAGVVTPMLSRRHLQAHKDQVDSDLLQIRTALEEFVRDTRSFPIGPGGEPRYHFLHSDGRLPEPNPMASGEGASLSTVLPTAGALIDPWGRAYVVNIHGFFSPVEHVLLLCAGPNGQIDTEPSRTRPRGDDVLLRFEL